MLLWLSESFWLSRNISTDWWYLKKQILHAEGWNCTLWSLYVRHILIFLLHTYMSSSTLHSCTHVYDCTIIVLHCDFFGRNYLVRLRPFGRSCRAMELQRMNSLQGYFTGKQTSTTMIPQVSTTLTTSHYNLSSLLWSSLSWPVLSLP